MSAKSWLIKFFLIIFLLGFFSYLLAPLVLNERTDAYYLRFTTDRQNSLILGSSRSAQGIVPLVINRSDLDFEGALYNFSFTGTHSPYGPVYNDSIRKKIDSNTQGGLFILEVNPKSLSYDSRVTNDDNPDNYREVGLFLDQVKNINVNPNIGYIAKAYKGTVFNLLSSQFSSSSPLYLHKNGWLEVTISMDSEDVKKRVDQKIQKYSANFKYYRPSYNRRQSLAKLIVMLKHHGRVVLTRLPVSPAFLELENNYAPEFNEEMISISDAHDIEFIDLTSESHKIITTDGNHLYKDSAIDVTRQLVERLLGKND